MLLLLWMDMIHDVNKIPPDLHLDSLVLWNLCIYVCNRNVKSIRVAHFMYIND